jgi:hypothetical protein
MIFVLVVGFNFAFTSTITTAVAAAATAAATAAAAAAATAAATATAAGDGTAKIADAIVVAHSFSNFVAGFDVDTASRADAAATVVATTYSTILQTKRLALANAPSALCTKELNFRCDLIRENIHITGASQWCAGQCSVL